MSGRAAKRAGGAATQGDGNNDAGRLPGDSPAALAGVTHVCQLAAAVGIGQRMYEIDHYVDVHNRGAVLLLEALIEQPVQRAELDRRGLTL